VETYYYDHHSILIVRSWPKRQRSACLDRSQIYQSDFSVAHAEPARSCIPAWVGLVVNASAYRPLSAFKTLKNHLNSWNSTSIAACLFSRGSVATRLRCGGCLIATSLQTYWRIWRSACLKGTRSSWLSLWNVDKLTWYTPTLVSSTQPTNTNTVTCTKA